MKRVVATLFLPLSLAACAGPASTPDAASATAPVASTSSSPPPSAPETAAPVMPDAGMAKRAPGQVDSAPLTIFRAFGTEPFWNVAVEGERLVYTTPDDQAGLVLQGTRRPVAGGVEIAGEHAGMAFALTVVTGDCGDGMSDQRHVLVSTFQFDGKVYRGCGEAAK